jgi:hypothetical protein
MSRRLGWLTDRGQASCNPRKGEIETKTYITCLTSHNTRAAAARSSDTQSVDQCLSLPGGTYDATTALTTVHAEVQLWAMHVS